MAMHMPSPTAMAASFSFYDSPSSTTSQSSLTSKDKRVSSEQEALAPYPAILEPSPVDSSGTNGTDIDDDVQEDQGTSKTTKRSSKRNSTTPLEPTSATSPMSPDSQLEKIDTSIAQSSDQDPDTGPQSVIHAPQSFSEFKEPQTPSMSDDFPQPSPSVRSDNTVVSPASPEALSSETNRENATPINTDVPQASGLDRPTPQAQTIQEAEEEWNAKKLRAMNLEGIPENQAQDPKSNITQPQDNDNDKSTIQSPDATAHHAQIQALDAALNECWTLCNTLAGLSSNHRMRIFQYRGKSDIQGQAWRSCWRLCQSLYDNRNEDHGELVKPTLEMCREFCQALFEARQRGDEATDSVLRVSFELNNHLYNTHNRSLPGAFQERTLDFYLTLCHRLMKQRTSLPQETDALLRACWTLAELLFSIRQNKREGKGADEDLLGSAVQACWDLCDLFREGWTQVRPESRTTPRANQTTFPHSNSQTSFRSQSSFSNRSSPSLTRSSTSQSYRDAKPFPPETPTTIFDDTADPLDINDDANIPNILVLGPDQSGSIYTNSTGGHAHRWSSAASNLSGYSNENGSSYRSASTATGTGSSPDVINRIRALLLTTATNAGFPLSNRVTSPTSAASNSSQQRSQQLIQQNNALVSYVKSLPPNTLGPQPWHTSLLSKYKKLVVAWPAVTRVAAKSSKNPSAPTSPGLLISPNAGRKISAAEIARAVQWMARSEHYGWLADLFKVVYGREPAEALRNAAGQ